MVRTLLAPVDCSELSEQAAPYAERLAAALGARLMFLRALPGSASSSADAASAPGWASLALTQLSRLVAHARAEGLEAHGLIRNEDPGHAILNASRELPADLIVMATHARAGVGRALWGSVADFVLRQAPTPVLLVPRGTRFNWATDHPFRVLVPLDGSPLAEKALPLAELLAAHLQGELLLVQAVEDPLNWLGLADAWATQYAYVAETRAQQREAAAAYLDPILVAAAHKGIAGQALIVEGRPAAAIQEAARDRDVQLIVMATHGRGGAVRLLLGSVAADLVHSARVPVLLVRATPTPPRSADYESALRSQARRLFLRMTPFEREVLRAALENVVKGQHEAESDASAQQMLERVRELHYGEPVPKRRGE